LVEPEFCSLLYRVTPAQAPWQDSHKTQHAEDRARNTGLK
jgi:hypothetical protein